MSHYIKLMLDYVFGSKNFRNEIVWCYNRWSNIQSQFQRMHDIILFYSKTAPCIFNEIRLPLDTPRKRNLVEVKEGRKVSMRDSDGNIVYKEQTDRPLSSWWADIISVPKRGGERLGYPTQKPKELLKRIISASSNERVNNESLHQTNAGLYIR